MKFCGRAIVSELMKTSTVDFFYKDLWTQHEHWGFHSSSGVSGETTSVSHFAHSMTIAPVRASFDATADIVGLVAGIAPWDLYLSRLLPEGTNGVYAVLFNSCAQVVSFQINGPKAIYLGEGDLHDKAYDYLKETLSFTGFGLSTEASRRAGQCDYFLALYPSDEYRSDYEDKRAEFFTVILGSLFLAVGVSFLLFALYVQRRQHKVMTTALKTNQIVAGLFPANVRDRILKDAEDQIEDTRKESNSQNLKKYLSDEKQEASKRVVAVTSEGSDESVADVNIFGSKPIADLFPETTLMVRIRWSPALSIPSYHLVSYHVPLLGCSLLIWYASFI